MFPVDAGNFGVYNMQLLSRSDEEGAYEPTVGNYISGKPFKVDCYIERIPDERLPKADASDEEEAKFLYEVFEKKVNNFLNWHCGHSPLVPPSGQTLGGAP